MQLGAEREDERLSMRIYTMECGKKERGKRGQGEEGQYAPVSVDSGTSAGRNWSGTNAFGIT